MIPGSQQLAILLSFLMSTEPAALCLWAIKNNTAIYTATSKVTSRAANITWPTEFGNKKKWKVVLFVKFNFDF